MTQMEFLISGTEFRSFITKFNLVYVQHSEHKLFSVPSFNFACTPLFTIIVEQQSQP